MFPNGPLTFHVKLMQSDVLLWTLWEFNSFPTSCRVHILSVMFRKKRPMSCKEAQLNWDEAASPRWRCWTSSAACHSQNTHLGLCQKNSGENACLSGDLSECILQSLPAFCSMFCLDDPGIRLRMRACRGNHSQEREKKCQEVAQFPVWSKCVQEKRRRGEERGRC